jgi:hypothetical protein
MLGIVCQVCSYELECYNATVVNSSHLVYAIAAVSGAARSFCAAHTSTRDVANPVI